MIQVFFQAVNIFDFSIPHVPKMLFIQVQ